MLFTLALLFSVVVLAEIALRTISYRARQRAHSQSGSYSLMLLATDGKTSLSDHEGSLKLILDPLVTYRNLPNQREARFTINSRGYRGPDTDEAAGLKRIILVGGSTAFGDGAESDEATVARALERRLPGARVINAAVNGHVSSDEVTLLQRELLDLDPALVIALDAFNDTNLSYVTGSGNLQTNSTFRDLEQRLIRLRAIESNPLWGFWAFARSIFPEVLSRVEKLERLPGRIRQDFYGEMPADPLEPKIRNYTANVLKMNSLCRERGIPFLAVLQPQRPNEWRHAEYYNKRYNDFIGSAAAAFENAELDYLNLHAASEIRKEHFFPGGDIHFDADGAEVAAGLIAGRILEQNLLLAEPRPTGSTPKDRRGAGR